MSGFRFEAYAIVSADGMLADVQRHMSEQLHIAADQRFFTEALDRAALVVHGAHSHESPRICGSAHGWRPFLFDHHQGARLARRPNLIAIWEKEHEDRHPADLPAFRPNCSRTRVSNTGFLIPYRGF